MCIIRLNFYISLHPTIPTGFLAHISSTVSAAELQALGQNQGRLILLAFVFVHDDTLNQYCNSTDWEYETPHSQGSRTDTAVYL